MTRDDAWTEPEIDGPSPALEACIREELAPDEKLVWVGYPRPGLALLGLTPTLLWTLWTVGFGVVCLTIMVSGKLDPSLKYLLGIMVLGGIASSLYSLRSSGAAMRAGYFLTSRRAVIRTPGPRGQVNVKSFYPQTLGGMVRKQRPDGSGDLIFEEAAATGAKIRQIRPRGFLGIANVHQVENLVSSTLLNHQAF